MSSLTKPFLPLGSRRRAWARRIYKQLASLTGTDISTEVAAHRSLPADALAELEAELRTKYFNRQSAGYLETEQGRCDLANHLTNRLETARSQTVPWL